VSLQTPQSPYTYDIPFSLVPPYGIAREKKLQFTLKFNISILFAAMWANIAHMQKMKALLGWQNADGLDSRAQADACANEKPMKSQ